MPKKAKRFDETICADILLDIFKYFDLKERIRYERVAVGWREALVTYWGHQQSIALVTKDKHFKSHRQYVLAQLHSCQDSSHQIRECDVVRVKSKKKIHRYCYELLRRCYNLKTLAFVGPVPDDLYMYLSTCCPRLEHIQSLFEKDTCKHWFQCEDLTKSLRCFIVSDSRGAGQFLNDCPVLSTIHTNIIESKHLLPLIKGSNGLLKSVSVLPRTLVNRVDNFEFCSVKKMISESGGRLHSISLGPVDGRKHMETWAKFDQLVQLEFASKADRLMLLTGLKNLRELKWRLKASDNHDGYLKPFLDIMGPQLTRLELSQARCTWADLSACNNLQELTILEAIAWHFSVKDIDNIPALPNLRTFVLQYAFRHFDHDFYNYFHDYDSVISAEFTQELLTQAPKLRSMMLCELNKDVVRVLARFSQAHPKRPITVYNFYFGSKKFKKLNPPGNLRILPSTPVATFM